MPTTAPTRPHPALPAEGRAGLDRQAARAAARKHGLPVVGLLGLEQLPGGHADDARADALLREAVCAATTSWTSEPVPIRIRSGAPPGASASTYAPRREPVGRRRSRTVQHRDLLPREHQRGRAVPAREGHPPGLRGLVGVGRADDDEIRHRAQRGQVLDRLVGRPVLAEADGVVREDEDRPAGR